MAMAADDVTRVLVVDDSSFMRRVITDILESDSSIHVIDMAKDGSEALEKIKLLKPDVVTLDVEMPVMGGIKCLQKIMEDESIPVIMLSSLTRRGTDSTIQALELGAIDFVTKPENIFDMRGLDKKLEIIEKVKIARNSLRLRRKQANTAYVGRKDNIPRNTVLKNIIAIGTSTGGPKALQQVIPLIPGDIPAAVLIVQHMPPGFTKSLAERLDTLSEISVKEAEDMEPILPGFAYIAPGGYHMMVQKNDANTLCIRLSQSPPVGGHRPSVDVMMESLSDTGMTNIIGVIMTGMGGDGSRGIQKLKKVNKSFIVVQDEKSCVVYGMPRVAVQTGAVDSVVPLDKIAGEIVKTVGVYK